MASQTILLVEDETALRRLMRRMLEKQGFSVVEASGPDQALAAVDTADGPLDLLVTDLMMPGLTGRQLAETLARRRPEMKVLYMSGYSRDEVEAQGLLPAGLPFLSKPFDLSRLSAAIRSALQDQPETLPRLRRSGARRSERRGSRRSARARRPSRS